MLDFLYFFLFWVTFDVTKLCWLSMAHALALLQIWFVVCHHDIGSLADGHKINFFITNYGINYPISLTVNLPSDFLFMTICICYSSDGNEKMKNQYEMVKTNFNCIKWGHQVRKLFYPCMIFVFVFFVLVKGFVYLKSFFILNLPSFLISHSKDDNFYFLWK